MKILAIETSCDETGVSILDCQDRDKTSPPLRTRLRGARPRFKILAHLVSSQIALHRKWGGVVPSLAKREHTANLVPLLLQALTTAGLKKTGQTIWPVSRLKKILAREGKLAELFSKKLTTIAIPKVDVIAVTKGPGLEPALWAGINFARALSFVWQKPLVPINHLEGHIITSLLEEKGGTSIVPKIFFPALSLLVSGGHTELVLIKDWLKYKVIGATRDDAVGEAFDKVARILGLPYPGGPEIAKLADQAEALKDLDREKYKLPRPMLNSKDFDFSFSGLKTAVLYLVKKLGQLTETDKAAIAKEFQDAAIEVLIAKTLRAVKHFRVSNLIIGGGVVSNLELRRRFKAALDQDHPAIWLSLPDKQLATDNATMIGLAGYFQFLAKGAKIAPVIKADGNLKLR